MFGEIVACSLGLASCSSLSSNLPSFDLFTPERAILMIDRAPPGAGAITLIRGTASTQSQCVASEFIVACTLDASPPQTILIQSRAPETLAQINVTPSQHDPRSELAELQPVALPPTPEHNMTFTVVMAILVVETAGIILGFALSAGYLLNERGREILAHGFTAGMVGVIIAGFDLALHEFASGTEPITWAYRIGLVIAVFIVIGLVVIMLEISLEHRQIRLENVGAIDGDYIDAIYDQNGQLSRGSVIKISSTRGKGFAITGTSYSPGDMKPVGNFDGTGSVAGSDGIAYYYNGYDFLTTLLTHDSGICYYRFLRSKSSDHFAFIGGFMAFGLGHSHQVFGRKILPTENETFKKDGGVVVLQKYLKDEAPTTAPIIQKATRDSREAAPVPSQNSSAG